MNAKKDKITSDQRTLTSKLENTKRELDELRKTLAVNNRCKDEICANFAQSAQKIVNKLAEVTRQPEYACMSNIRMRTDIDVFNKICTRLRHQDIQEKNASDSLLVDFAYFFEILAPDIRHISDGDLLDLFLSIFFVKSAQTVHADSYNFSLNDILLLDINSHHVNDKDKVNNKLIILYDATNAISPFQLVVVCTLSIHFYAGELSKDKCLKWIKSHYPEQKTTTRIKNMIMSSFAAGESKKLNVFTIANLVRRLLCTHDRQG